MAGPGTLNPLLLPFTGRLYRTEIDQYYDLNLKEARAYSLYACCTTLMPNLIVALILFYGGQVMMT